MELSELTGKVYYEVRFEDVADWWVLGARCGSCGYEAPIDRDRLQRRSGEAYLRFAAKYIRCTACNNRHHNRIYVAGKLPR